MTQTTNMFSIVLCGVLATFFGCEKDFKVQGALDRVIGEKVTLELERGEGAFTDDISLPNFDRTQLQIEKTSDKIVSFVIPSGIAVGETTVTVKTQGDPGQFEVPLNINRLMVALFDDFVATHPLEPATLQPHDLQIQGGQKIALSPDGALLALLSNTKLRVFRLSKDGFASKVFAAYVEDETGAICVAAHNRGVLFATSEKVEIRTIPAWGIKEPDSSLPISGAKSIAVDDNGTFAVVLKECGESTKLYIGSDCLVQIENLDGKNGATPFVSDETIHIDESPSA
ncbi:MAG: hypothetical protein V1754_04215, partial [Pseudomonadota bacterium]